MYLNKYHNPSSFTTLPQPNFISDLSRFPFVYSDSQQRAITHIIDDWENSDKHLVVNFIYYASYILMRKDVAFRNSMLLSDYILVDGIGMQIYFKTVTGKWVSNLNGTDTGPDFISEIYNRKLPLAFYGTTQENIEGAISKTETRLGGQAIYYFQNGFEPLNWDQIKDRSVLFVGMGSPRQENWVKANWKQITEKKLFVMTVGGFFDFCSGYYIRAPLWVRKIKMEWAWRTMLHPSRHLKKRLRDLTVIYRPVVDQLQGAGRQIRFLEI
jgi:exopolysaccharide biosynthesis WecB/TagA/CpsF family protein